MPTELVKLALGTSAHTVPALGLALVEKLPKLMPKRNAKLIALGDELKRDLAARIAGR